MITHVTVYSPKGKPEKHLRLNAVDLVRHAGYTYKPGRVYAPTDAPAYAMSAQTAPTVSATQDVLNRHGHRSGNEVAPAPSFQAEPEVVFDAAKLDPQPAPPPIESESDPDETGEDETADETAGEETSTEETAAPARRGRPKKNAE